MGGTRDKKQHSLWKPQISLLEGVPFPYCLQSSSVQEGEETVRPSWLVVADGKDAEMALSLATWFVKGEKDV